MIRPLFIICHLLFLVLTGLRAQEIPPVRNFKPQDYQADRQNWSISQSDEKYVYIGNNDGLLEFNGARWKLYPTPNNSVIRCVNAYKDRIYTGCFREFGYWMRNELGYLEYTSLSDRLKEPVLENDNFLSIVTVDEWVLFQTSQRIYIFNTIDGTFKIISSENEIRRAFKADENIYYQILGEGVYKFEKGKPKQISSHPVLRENRLVNIFNEGNRLLFQTTERGFYFLDESGFSKWEIPADGIISNLSVYASQRLRDGSFILGTISKGLYQLDRSGNLINHIDRNKGLNNNTILGLFQDLDQNLWLGLDNGIALINTNSQFSYYSGSDENLGAVYTAVIFDDNMYLGTNQGLYVKKNNSKDLFQFVPGTEGQVWCLRVFDNTLFCGHDTGTFTIKDKTATPISNISGIWDIKPVNKNENILIQGDYNGLSVLEKTDNSWKLKNKITGLNISSNQFEILSDSLIFVNHEIDGLYKLTVNADFTNITKFKIENSVPGGLKTGLIKFDNSLLYATPQGIFEYDTGKEKFVKDTLLSQNLIEKDGFASGRLIPEEHENAIWAFTDKNLVRLVKGNLNNTMRPERFPISAKSRDFVKGYENMYQLDKDKYLFGTSNGYLVFDLSKKNFEPQNFKISITSIENSVLDQKKVMLPLIGESRFPSDQNNLFFSFSVPVFGVFEEVYYQFKLEGIYDNWSEWTKSPEVAFSNLPFGKYTFKVKARIGNKLSDNIASHTFTIDRPWYLSNKMLAEYAIVFLLLLGLIHYTYITRFNKQKRHLIEEKKQELMLSQLEAEKKIIQLKNEALQTEIESKRKELSASTINLLEKSEFLNNIKKELDHVKNDKELKPVIKILNKKLTSHNDWEKFQEVFNNADSDFLKKIKTLHPSLTAHDLRICTFLRLNLSSKEIAALLNISPKSIEIKRFRLRKKLNLPHEESLVAYILSI